MMTKKKMKIIGGYFEVALGLTLLKKNRKE